METRLKVIIIFLAGITIALFFTSIQYGRTDKYARKSYMLPCQQGGSIEWGERDLVFKYLDKDACVLEFGGGAGSVSTTIQRIINTPTDHVVIEPGGENSMFGGLEQLKENKKSCKSKFHIIDHILEKGESQSVRDLVSKNFDTIVADCENCLGGEYAKNPELFEYVTTILVERDDFDRSYDSLFSTLGMQKVSSGFHSDLLGMVSTEMWKKM